MFTSPAITTEYARSYQKPRTQEDWAASDDHYASRGFLLCSFGDNRYVNPVRFLRQMPDGTRLGLCLDRQGRHQTLMGAGKDAFNTFMQTWATAEQIFPLDGPAPTLDQVRKAIREGDPLITLRDALDAGFRQRDTDDTAEASDEAPANVIETDQVEALSS